jgi:uncharacterized protein (DUF1778 family)
MTLVDKRCGIVSRAEILYANVIQSTEHQTMDAVTPSNPSVMSVRLSASERAILEAAAAQAHTTLSDYVRRKALVEAEMELMDRRVITIPAEDWEKFEAWVKEPGEDMPELRRLAATRLTWEQ